MLLSGLRDREIEQCFAENPDLMNKTLKQVALFFYIQGELGNCHERARETARANFYRQNLGVLDKELMEDCDKQWENSGNISED